MRTSLYLPFKNFVINDSAGEILLYKALVESGPSYRLIVHDSPQWRTIAEEVAGIEEIMILTEEDSRRYKELANKFFSPITEEMPPYYFVNNEKVASANLTSHLKRFLSYILIAYDFRARVYDSHLFNLDNSAADALAKAPKKFSEDAISRARFAESLISGYQKDSVGILSINSSSELLGKIKNILDKEEVKKLSGLNHLFGELRADKNKLKRDINAKLSEGIKNKWFPDMVALATVGISYYPSLKEIGPVLSVLSRIGAKVLSQYDFREYLPPVEHMNLISLAIPPGQTTGTFSYEHFNYEYAILI
jgi:hypothetical protein